MLTRNSIGYNEDMNESNNSAHISGLNVNGLAGAPAWHRILLQTLTQPCLLCGHMLQQCDVTVGRQPEMNALRDTSRCFLVN